MKSLEPSTIEHLKAFSGLVIDQYHEGTAPDPAVAKMRMWEELQRCLANHTDAVEIEGTPYWLRLSGDDAAGIMQVLQESIEETEGCTVVALRWLGPRTAIVEMESDVVFTEGETVAWAVIDTTDFSAAVKLHKRLTSAEKLVVRDGTFGGVNLG